MDLKDFIVSGKDIKQLPLKVACEEEYAESVKEFISAETSWSLVKVFKENYLSSNEPNRFIDYVIGFDHNYAFDLVIIKNFSQICENELFAVFLTDEMVPLIPVFCIDSEEIISNLSNDAMQCVNEIGFMREDELLW